MINMLVLQHIHPDCKLAKKHIDIDQGVYLCKNSKNNKRSCDVMTNLYQCERKSELNQ